MKLLGIDTSTRTLSIGIADGQKIYEYSLAAEKMHSALLVPTIKRLIDGLGLSLKDMDFFACGIGPGSFTGVRIACATIKGLCYSLDKPVIAVPSLDILAQNALFAGAGRYSRIVPLVDAKRGLVYCGVYSQALGVLKRVRALRLVPFSEALTMCKPGTVVLGDALALYANEFSRGLRGVMLLDKDYWAPAGRGIIARALVLLKEKKAADAFNLNPLYLYPKECQIK